MLKQTGEIDEIKYGIKTRPSEEIDIILRKGNRLAIVECKQGNTARSASGILQLNNLASEKHLGIYTCKILVVASAYPPNNVQMAHEHRVRLLELPDWQKGHVWTENELKEFRRVVQETLG